MDMERYFLVQAYWHVQGMAHDCVQSAPEPTGAHVHVHGKIILIFDYIKINLIIISLISTYISPFVDYPQR